MRILLWHVHGSWTTAFVQGAHDYLVPVVPDRGAHGRGRARTWDWPATVRELEPTQLADADIDVVVLQRAEDEQLARRWLGGRVPGRDLPALWLEHSAPQGRIDAMRHPAADRSDLTLVHVTHANALFWDTGRTPTTVIEHGIIDPGARYTGELERVAVVVNEPDRRGRVVGADLLPALGASAPVDLFGMGARACAARLRDTASAVTGHEDLPQDALHAAVARRRAYVHTARWTSLGLSLLEAMHLAMPVVALGTLEVPDAVPPDAGVVTTRPAVMVEAVRRFVADPEEAMRCGKAARAAALERYGLDRFLADWDHVLTEVTG